MRMIEHQTVASLPLFAARDVAVIRVDGEREALAERESGEAACHKVLPLLLAHGDWMTRRDLELLHGIGQREARMAGEYSDGAIIFGQHGYRAAARATRDELEACATALDGQAHKMRLRAQKVRAYLHTGRTVQEPGT